MIKKILLMIGVSTYIFAACPDLSVGVDSKTDKLRIIDMMKKEDPNTYVSYIDIIRGYNKDKIENHLDISSLKELQETKIYKFVRNKNSFTRSKEENKEYQAFIKSIDKNDEKWCERENY